MIEMLYRPKNCDCKSHKIPIHTKIPIHKIHLEPIESKLVLT